MKRSVRFATCLIVVFVLVSACGSQDHHVNLEGQDGELSSFSLRVEVNPESDVLFDEWWVEFSFDQTSWSKLADENGDFVISLGDLCGGESFSLRIVGDFDGTGLTQGVINPRGAGLRLFVIDGDDVEIMLITDEVIDGALVYGIGLFEWRGMCPGD